MSSTGTKAPALRYRPIYGGIFGRSGEYVMATMACLERGLHSVRYMVLHPRSGGVLSVANGKTEALEQARRVLKAAAKLSTANDASFLQPSLWPESEMPEPVPGAPPRPQAIPRKRRELFERYGGRCHYCNSPLNIDAFEVEHMLPRALGGTDDGWNLTISCRPCNAAKSTKTAIQYVTQNADSDHAA